MSFFNMIMMELLNQANNSNHHSNGYDKIPLVSILLSIFMFIPVDIVFKIITSLVIIIGNIPNLLKAYDALKERKNKKHTNDVTDTTKDK